MEEKKKEKLKKWSIWGGLVLLILFVIITSVILYAKKSELARIKDENDKIFQEIVISENDVLG